MATRNRYAEIMAQYAQSQPFSFFGYPQTYSGGFTANPSTYTGGFTPYERLVTPRAAAPVEEIPTSATTGGGGGGGGGRGTPEEGGATFTEPTSEQAYNVSTLGRNLRYVSPLFGGLASMYGNYLAGQVNPNYSNEGRNYPAPTGGFLSSEAAQSDTSNYSNEGRNYSVPTGGRPYGTGPIPPSISENDFNAAQAAFAQPAETQSLLNRYPAPSTDTGGLLTTPTIDAGVTFSTGTGDFSSQYGPDQYGPGISAGETLNRQMAQDRADAAAAQAAREQAGREAARQVEAQMAAQAQAQADAAAAAAAQNYSNEGRNYGGGGGGGGGAATGGRDTGGGARDASGGGDRGTRGGFAKGGYVSMQHLGGPDPMGPDDGYAALKDGEFVINDKAVKKYGIELMQAINSGKISKGKLRGLLEM